MQGTAFPQNVTKNTRDAIQIVQNTSTSLDPIANPLKIEAATGVLWAKIAAFVSCILAMAATFENTSDLLSGTQSFIEAPLEFISNFSFVHAAPFTALNIISGSIGTAINVTVFLLGFLLGLQAVRSSLNFLQNHMRNALTTLGLPNSLINTLSLVLNVSVFASALIYGIPLMSTLSGIAAAATKYVVWYAFSLGIIGTSALLATAGLGYLFCKAFNLTMPNPLVNLSKFLIKQTHQALSAIISQMKLSNNLPSQAFMVISAVLMLIYTINATVTTGLIAGSTMALTLGLQALFFNVVYAANRATLIGAHNFFAQTADALAFSKLVVSETLQGNKSAQKISYVERLLLIRALNAFKMHDPFMKGLNSQFDLTNTEHYKKFINYLIDNDYESIFPILQKLGANKNDCNFHGREEWAAIEVLANRGEKKARKSELEISSDNDDTDQDVIEEKTEDLFPKRLSLQWQAAKKVAEHQIPLTNANSNVIEIVNKYQTWNEEDKARKNSL